MWRKVTVALVVMLVTLSFAGAAFAVPRMMRGEAIAGKTTVGEVISVDPSASTLTIQAQGHEMTLNVLKKAAKPLSNLAPGDKVTVSYIETWGSPTAESVTKS